MKQKTQNALFQSPGRGSVEGHREEAVELAALPWRASAPNQSVP